MLRRKHKPFCIFGIHFRKEDGLICRGARYHLVHISIGKRRYAPKRCTVATVRARNKHSSVTKSLKESCLEGNHLALSRPSDLYLNVRLCIFHDSLDGDVFASTMNRTWLQERWELCATDNRTYSSIRRMEKLGLYTWKKTCSTNIIV